MNIQLEQVRFVEHISIPSFADTHINVNDVKTRHFTIWATTMGVVIERPTHKDVLVPWQRIQSVVALKDIDWASGLIRSTKAAIAERVIEDIGKVIAQPPAEEAPEQKPEVKEEPKPRKSRR